MSDRLFRIFIGSFAFIVLIGVVGILWIFHLLGVRDVEIQQNCAEIASTPLDSEITTSLCQGGLVPLSIGDCSSLDFQIHVEDIEAIFRENIQEGTTTYGEVTDRFGEYSRFCEEMSDANSEFRCIYDISGRSLGASVYFDNATEIVQSIHIVGCSAEG